MCHKLITVAAWVLLAFIAYATISPIQDRPSLPMPSSFEHLAAFAVLGALFYLVRNACSDHDQRDEHVTEISTYRANRRRYMPAGVPRTECKPEGGFSAKATTRPAKIKFCPMLAVILAHWAPLLRWQAEGWQAQALPAEE
jgi:hypothetical protein